MNKKISELGTASALTGTEYLEVLQGGVNKKVFTSSVLSFAIFVDGEVPSGAVNSSNVTFTLANTPIAGSVHVYLNGIRMKLTTDYTISGAVITFVIAPTTGDSVGADYRR